MNSKSEHGKKGGKKTSASSKSKSAAPEDKKDLFDGAFEEDDNWGQFEEDEFGSDADLFDETPKVKKQSGKKKNTDDDFDFEDDMGGLDFLDDSYYDDDDDLY